MDITLGHRKKDPTGPVPSAKEHLQSLLLHKPERAVALFIDHAHKVACSTAFGKLGSLAARRGDDGRSERLALGHPPSAGRNQLHLCRALRLEDPTATGQTHSLDAVLTPAEDASVQRRRERPAQALAVPKPHNTGALFCFWVRQLATHTYNARLLCAADPFHPGTARTKPTDTRPALSDDAGVDVDSFVGHPSPEKPTTPGALTRFLSPRPDYPNPSPTNDRLIGGATKIALSRHARGSLAKDTDIRRARKVRGRSFHTRSEYWIPAIEPDDARAGTDARRNDPVGDEAVIH